MRGFDCTNESSLKNEPYLTHLSHLFGLLFNLVAGLSLDGPAEEVLQGSGAARVLGDEHDSNCPHFLILIVCPRSVYALNPVVMKLNKSQLEIVSIRGRELTLRMFG